MIDEGRRKYCATSERPVIYLCVNEATCPSGHQVGEGPPVTVYILARGRQEGCDSESGEGLEGRRTWHAGAAPTVCLSCPTISFSHHQGRDGVVVLGD